MVASVNDAGTASVAPLDTETRPATFQPGSAALPVIASTPAVTAVVPVKAVADPESVTEPVPVFRMVPEPVTTAENSPARRSYRDACSVPLDTVPPVIVKAATRSLALPR